MKAPLILIPFELNLGSRPKDKRSPKFWFGDRVEVKGKFGVVYGVDYRPADVFPNFAGWWYRIRFDNAIYDCLVSHPETLVHETEWAN